MKTLLAALTLMVCMVGSALAAPEYRAAATQPMYKTCQPFYYGEDANTFMNTLTQQQRDMAQLVPLTAFECPPNATCTSFLWIVEYEAPGPEAAIHGCGKVPGNDSSAASSVFGR